MKTWRWTLLMVASGALAFACNGDETEETTSGPSTTSTGGSTTTATTTATTVTSSSTGGAMGCYNANGALQAIGDMTLVGLDLCTAQQIDDHYTACLDMAATMDTCMTWETANQECMDCIWPINEMGNSAASAPVLLPAMTYVFVNRYACEAAAQGLPQCGLPTATAWFCMLTACETCDFMNQAELDACTTEAQNGVCMAAFDAIPAECDPVINAQTFSPQCDGMDFQEIYTNIGNYFCGPPA